MTTFQEEEVDSPRVVDHGVPMINRGISRQEPEPEPEPEPEAEPEAEPEWPDHTSGLWPREIDDLSQSEPIEIPFKDLRLGDYVQGQLHVDPVTQVVSGAVSKLDIEAQTITVSGTQSNVDADIQNAHKFVWFVVAGNVLEPITGKHVVDERDVEWVHIGKRWVTVDGEQWLGWEELAPYIFRSANREVVSTGSGDRDA